MTLVRPMIYGGVSHGKQKRKIKYSFFFPTFSSLENKSWEFSHSIWFSNTNSTYTYLRLMSTVTRQGTGPPRQEYWISVRKTSSIELEGISHNKSEAFSLTVWYKKNLSSLRTIPFLYSISVTSTVFLKTS